MKDMDDLKLKTEINEISSRIDNIIKKIETLDPVKKEEMRLNERKN